MRRMTAAGIVTVFGIAMVLGGCGASEGSDTDQGPGDGPVANEAPPSQGSGKGTPTQGSTSSPGAPGSPGSGAPGSSSSSGSSGAEPADQVLARGEFVDKSYSGSGDVLLIKGGDGAAFLRLENIAISAGPALHVLLTKVESPSSKMDVDKGSVDLGVLRATKGNLTYTIPAGTDVTGFGGVIVYCVDYSMVFAAATLKP